MEIDELGLDAVDRRLLQTMIKSYNGGPVGLETISAAIGEESVTIEDVYEPYLMQIGFLARTPRGIIVTIERRTDELFQCWFVQCATIATHDFPVSILGC